MAYSVLIVPEGVEASDGRSYDPGELTWRDDFTFQFTDETSDGHLGAFNVGRISNIRRQTFEGLTWVIGDLSYDVDAEAAEAERLAVDGMIPGVSVDVAEIWEATDEVDEQGFPMFERIAAEIVGATQVAMPAFGGARVLTDVAVPVLVAALPVEVKAEWFTDPMLEAPTPLRVDGSRVYGHLATWGTCHTGFGNVCVTPPKGTDYSYFHTGAVNVEGHEIPVGHITMGTGHAPLTSSNAVSHYDDTGTCAADVVVGEDEHGIWFSGVIREGVDTDTLRSASLSGDWRRVGGNMELLAALAVNVPGFPIPRITASALNDEPLALVASGIVVEDEPDPVDALIARVAAIEEQIAQATPKPAVETVANANIGEEWPSLEDTEAWGKLASLLD